MIERYEHKTITSFWRDEAKYAGWLTILEKWANQVSDDATCEKMIKTLDDYRRKLSSKKEKADWCKRIKKREEEVKHDVAAFIDVVAKDCGPPVDQWIAYGLTSSDLVDTRLSAALQASAIQINKLLAQLMASVEGLAIAHARDVCVGRTHGRTAELTTFGHRMANFYQDLGLIRQQIYNRTINEPVGMLSGPVGTCSHSPRDDAEVALLELGQMAAPISTQILSRVFFAPLAADLGILSTVLSKWATTFRLWMRSECEEVSLVREEKQKGSSSMPHKTNPIHLEKITGLRRIVTGYVDSLIEGIMVWEERDMSHSSVERLAWPDLFHTVAHQIGCFEWVLHHIVVNTDTMHLHAMQADNSFQRLHAMVRSGFTRADAYREIQSATVTYGGVGTNLWIEENGEAIEQQIRDVIQCYGY